MLRSLLCLISSFSFLVSYGNYSTPGTGVNWTLDDLVTNSGGNVSFADGIYRVNDTVQISVNDKLGITSNATVKFVVGAYFDVLGNIVINPPDAVVFTALDPVAGFHGMRIDFSTGSLVRKLTLEYANSLRLFDCSPVIDSCIFRFNTFGTNFGNGAISLFRSNAIITNSQFLNNKRAAITGGANINNAPKIIGCLFQGNNTLNLNVPQINLGATSLTGGDTTKILNNRILAASTNSGGIGFTALGNVYALVSGNTIKKNRYGIVMSGGSSLNSMISYNVIDSNNTQGDPLLGGSGINFTGGSATSHQNSIVTGNYIRWNLWGVTISATSATANGGAQPNLGNITNTDTSDDGKNVFFDNTNSGLFNDLYNNNVDPIFAQNNYWGSNDLVGVESKIFHQPDNAALGLVNYSNYILPVELSAFSARANRNDVILNWITLSENNSDYFEIERGANPQIFSAVGRVNASGISSTSKNYSFTDVDIKDDDNLVYYRLKLVDKDGKSKYSKVVAVKLSSRKNERFVKVYPTILSPSQTVHVEVSAGKEEVLSIQFLSEDGKLLLQSTKHVIAGLNSFTITPNVVLPKGAVYLRFKGEGVNEVIKVISR